MKLKNKWSQRLAVAVLSAAIAVSGGFVFSPQPTEAATVSAGTKMNTWRPL